MRMKGPFKLCLIPLMLMATSATHVDLGGNEIRVARRIKYMISTGEDGRIFGGELANIRDFPFMVSIQSFSDKWDHNCGGSILDSKTILTACHCIYTNRHPLQLISPDYTRIVAGIEDLRKPTNHTQVKRVTRLVPHPNCGDQFNGAELYHDVAAITLDSPLTFSSHVEPVKIFSGNVRQAKDEILKLETMGAECTSPGWGLIHVDPDIASPRLKLARKSLMTTHQCKKALCPYGRAFCINYHKFDQVCAVGSDSSVCNGDSGGPLICGGYLFGTVSYGVFCGKAVPQVYSDVVPILHFVDNLGRI